MSTGLIGAWSGVSSLSYTPNTPSKVHVYFFTTNSGYTIRINGIPMHSGTAGLIVDTTFWVGANQTVVIDTTGGGYAIISALEG